MTLSRLVALFLVPFVHGVSICPKESVFDAEFGKCFHFIAKPATYTDAEENCNAFNSGHLVTVETVMENHFLAGLAKRRGPFWIGFNFMKNEGGWTSGEFPSYWNMATEQPNDDQAKCVHMRDSDHRWIKEQCNVSRPYVCSSIPCHPIACGTNYQFLSSNCMCYSYNDTLRSYNASMEYCSSLNGVLAKVDSAETNKFLLGMNKTKSGGDDAHPFIGLFCDNNQQNSCFWQDKTQVSYSNFKLGEPAMKGPCSMETDGKWACANNENGGVFCEQRPGKRIPLQA